MASLSGTVTSDFDPQLYLRMHPDVRLAAADPVQHYLKYGRREGRSIRPTLRHEKLLSFIDYNKLGLEVGPSHSPICPRSRGYKVEILDHLSQPDLKTKYAQHGVDLNAIEAVDFVWSGQRFKDLTRRNHEYGWVVASHVIEHTPDLISFLQGCDDILQDDGVLVLAVPDKRFCFDYLRPVTSLAAIVDAYEAKRTVHSAGTAAEYYLNVCQIPPGKAWTKVTSSDLRIIHSVAEAKSAMEAARNSVFIDLHSWCFTPSSFRLILHDLFTLGFIQSREVGFFDSNGGEFIIALGRKGAGPEIPRTELALMAGRPFSAARGVGEAGNVVLNIGRRVSRRLRRLIGRLGHAVR
ncbi:MAG TPA: methyltransferase domain-containing protein [Rhodopseudomonas sp.]|uniref:methyltransferase domain-containing protein n=1 Tax=Rhodopseudomonas sp. TaxID=1078 RepID=UPI002ED79363